MGCAVDGFIGTCQLTVGVAVAAVADWAATVPTKAIITTAAIAATRILDLCAMAVMAEPLLRGVGAPLTSLRRPIKTPVRDQSEPAYAHNAAGLTHAGEWIAYRPA